MKATLDTFGRVDGCFANAGIGGGGRRAFIDRTEEEWRRMFATNLDGVFHVFQVAARHMTERAEAGDKFGRLVATSSLASLFGTARNEHYAGTKAALNALCRALAVELARYGVTANAILPGWIKSDMTAGIMGNEKFVANVMPRIPVRRFGEPSGFRRHRGVHHEQGVVVSYGGLFCDRWRLYGVLRLAWLRSAPFAEKPVDAPRRRGIQYAAANRVQCIDVSGILDRPPCGRCQRN